MENVLTDIGGNPPYSGAISALRAKVHPSRIDRVHDSIRLQSGDLSRAASARATKPSHERRIETVFPQFRFCGRIPDSHTCIQSQSSMERIHWADLKKNTTTMTRKRRALRIREQKIWEPKSSS